MNVDELIVHIAGRVARGKPVTFFVASARIALNALMMQAGGRTRTWEEDLHFELGIWDERGRLVEVLARLGNLMVARAAFRAAVIARPDSRVLLKQKAWVLADSAELRAGPRVAVGLKERNRPGGLLPRAVPPPQTPT